MTNVPFSVLKKARAMQETRKFIEAIQARASGRPHDYTLYFSTIEKCARAAYRSRLGWASVPDETQTEEAEEGHVKSKERRRREEVSDIPHPDVVEEIPFIDSCWEWMEHGLPVKGTRKKKGKDEYWKAGDRMGKLLFNLANTYFESDKDLERFLFTCLSNHLESMITDLTPGLDALKRQVDRVMKSYCIKGQSFWALDGAGHSAPVSPAALRRAANTIPLPEIQDAQDEGRRAQPEHPRCRARELSAGADGEMRGEGTGVRSHRSCHGIFSASGSGGKWG